MRALRHPVIKPLAIIFGTVIAFYIVGWFVWNPPPDEGGYLRALHKSAPVVFLDHTEPEMLSIGFQICQMVDDPNAPTDFTYTGDVSTLAVEYLCAD